MVKFLFGGEQLIVFALIGDTTFGVEVNSVVSIIESDKIRKVPLAPNHLNSIVNHQGRIVTIFDMKAYWGGGDTVTFGGGKIICLSFKELQIGLIVDKITGIEYVLPSCVGPTPEEKNDRKKSAFCQGLIVMSEDAPGIYFLETKKIEVFINQMEMFH